MSPAHQLRTKLPEDPPCAHACCRRSCMLCPHAPSAELRLLLRLSCCALALTLTLPAGCQRTPLPDRVFESQVLNHRCTMPCPSLPCRLPEDPSPSEVVYHHIKDLRLFDSNPRWDGASVRARLPCPGCCRLATCICTACPYITRSATGTSRPPSTFPSTSPTRQPVPFLLAAPTWRPT